MPRRAKLPDYIVETEGLSVRAEVRYEPDDFGEGMIAVPVQVDKPVKVITNWRKHLRDEKLKAEREVLERYIEQRDRAHKLLFEKREQTLAHNQTKLGQHVLSVPRKSWRRL